MTKKLFFIALLFFLISCKEDVKLPKPPAHYIGEWYVGNSFSGDLLKIVITTDTIKIFQKKHSKLQLTSIIPNADIESIKVLNTEEHEFLIETERKDFPFPMAYPFSYDYAEQKLIYSVTKLNKRE